MIASALATLVAMLAVVWICGCAIAPHAPAPERAGFGILAILGLAWVTMLQGPAGVGVLGHPWALRAIALALVAGLVAWRRPALAPGRIAWKPVTAAVAATACVVYPGFLVTTPQLRPGHEDMLWHQGWIRQLAAGIPAPGGVYAGEPNSYPWLYHSLTAWLLGTLPGDLNATFLALEVAGVAAGWLGIWLLARELGAPATAGAWAATLFTAAAGFGWIWQHHPAASLFPNGVDLGPYHGDLVLSNVLVPALGNVPPPLPRELATCLAPLALWLLVRGLHPGRERVLWAAGAAIGFTFVISPLAGGFCVAWAIVLAAGARGRAIWRTALATSAVAAVWLVPLGLAYHRYGGFVSITHTEPILPSLAETIVALGVVLPLGAAGTLAVAARPQGTKRTLIVLLVAVPALACVSGALLTQGSELFGTPALLRWSRYLPFLVLGLSVPAGVAAERLASQAGAVVRGGGMAIGLGLVAVAVPSTLLATAAVVHTPYPRQFTCSRLPPASALTAVANRKRTADAVAMNLFAQTGASQLYLRLVHAKVRFRTWLQRPPTQIERKAQYRALLLHGTVPPGVSWVVARPRTPLAGSGLIPAGSCRLAGHTYRLLRRG